MRTLNEVRLLGNIGANPTSHETDKIFVVKLSLATNGMNPNTGEISPPQWHRVTMFDKLARYAMQEVRKGMRIEVEGRLKYTTYEDSKGIERFGCEVIANRLWVIAKPQNQPQPEEQPEEAPKTTNGLSAQQREMLNRMAAALPAFEALTKNQANGSPDLPF